VEISEIDKEVIVRIAYPGVTLENWDIEVCDNMLNVKAKRDVQESNYNLVYCNSTFFSKSSFSTSFKLPQNVDTSTIEASYKDGILKITIPKSTASTSAKISVK
jgi:HSP20 family protein